MMGGTNFGNAAGVDLNVRRGLPVGAPQILEMAGAGAYGLGSLGVDFWRTAAARRGMRSWSLPFLFWRVMFLLCSVSGKTEARVKLLFF